MTDAADVLKQLRASQIFDDLWAITDLVEALGTMRYQPAVPVLAELWRACEVEDVRMACGHALREIGSADARAALAEFLHDADYFSVSFGVRAVFEDDPAKAFDRSSPYFVDELVGSQVERRYRRRFWRRSPPAPSPTTAQSGSSPAPQRGCAMMVAGSRSASSFVVGSVDFVWDSMTDDAPPRFGSNLVLSRLDPLSVDPARAAASDLAFWTRQRKDVNPELAGPYRLDLAPDYHHKVNTSGGPAYGIDVPLLGADPLLANEAHRLPFVDYLRLCFRWAGFPRLERYADEPGVQDFVQRMTEGLLPF